MPGNVTENVRIDDRNPLGFALRLRYIGELYNFSGYRASDKARFDPKNRSGEEAAILSFDGKYLKPRTFGNGCALYIWKASRIIQERSDPRLFRNQRALDFINTPNNIVRRVGIFGGHFVCTSDKGQWRATGIETYQ